MMFTRPSTPILNDYYNISRMKIVLIVDDLVDLIFKLSRTLRPRPHIAMISSRAL